MLGFHGCDKEVGEKLLRGEVDHLAESTNDYDWLGSGVYFWEANAGRALDFATQAAGPRPQTTRGKIKDPFVVGAVIDLGVCCNLLDHSALEQVQAAYAFLRDLMMKAEEPLPKNGLGFGARYLDCAVIETLHAVRAASGAPKFDTVRAAFVEGEPLYPGAGFHDKNHIQIAVRNLECIRGYFRLPKS